MNTKLKGIFSVMISAIIFGSMPLMAKIVFNEGGNPTSLAFYRFLLIIPFLYILIKRNKEETLKITKEEFKKIILVGTIGYGATALLLYLSYNYIPSGMATTIHFVYPVFVILGCILFFKEKPNIIKIISVILCVLGVLMFYDGNGNINFMGIFLAFASSITFAFYTIYLDKSGLKEMNTVKLTFYLCSIAAVMMFIFSIITKTFTIHMNPLGWLMSLFLSLSVGLGVNLFQIGIKIVGPQSTSILSTFEPITSVIIGVLILNESFGIRTFIGIGAILIAVILISIFDK
ncbi:EamA domain-containing membrane protein RarD [Tissierella praeacuta DSM 18095]|uniref:EamA domain-containing membrane protein RarD n=1 Tax=Tissierella praeacuta DSM 18095 TaxID=1123404 RepID=A0A1M4WVP2_9FIRM|nr:DMT family transporter [Tissierella praeacuta]SHE85133.1 EamA domain-containing membrane protein RarD [Tissierella praeacuta DSM 18095]SUP00438.1 aromatic amino acid exporter [Tissierella praeacuta]